MDPKKLPDIAEQDRHIGPITDGVEVEVEDDPILSENIEELPDGSAIITMEGDEESETPEFLENLAEYMEETELGKLSLGLIELVDADREAREKRDEKYKDGLRRTGLGDDAPGGAGFDGSSKVVHPILAESCVDFEARAIKELFPPSGPVKTQIIGKVTEAKMDRADRKARYLNYQMTKSMSEYRSELEQLLTQLPMGGSQYQKFWYDTEYKRPRTCFVPIDDVLLPYANSDFYSAHRVTHVLHLTDHELERRMASGMYRDLDLSTASDSGEQTATAEANDKIEGKQKSGTNEDGLRQVYEIQVYLELDAEDDDIANGEKAPYLITIDEESGKVLSIYRNWAEEDQARRKLQWMVEYKFIPWRGAYAIGLPHLIGGLSAAATGALRALLDSAHLNNSATMLKLKSGKQSGQSINVNPTEVAEIDAPAGTDDIRKVMMAMPYNQPSPVLFQLLGWLTDAGKGVVSTTQESMANAGDRTPVGTMMAMVEQGAVIYSAIHARLHHSQSMALDIMCRINYSFMDDEQTVAELDELMVKREDFENNNDVIPVTDPNIFSETQRFAQMQGVAQVMQLFPQEAFDHNYIARTMLKRMRLEDVDAILPERKKPQNMNPIGENVAAMQGTPLLALPKQNHIAHMMAHLEFAGNPVFGSPQLGMKSIPILIEHIKQHLGFFYSETIDANSGFSAEAGNIPTTEMELNLMQTQDAIMEQFTAQLTPILTGLQQLEQKAQEMAPKPPQDPSIAATVEVAMADIERKKAYDQAKLQIEQAESQARVQNDQAKLQVSVDNNAMDNRQHQQTELAKNHEDNMTAKWVAAMKEQQTEIMEQMRLQQNIFMEQMRAMMDAENEKVRITSELVKHDKDVELQREQGEADRQAAAAQVEVPPTTEE